MVYLNLSFGFNFCFLTRWQDTFLDFVNISTIELVSGPRLATHPLPEVVSNVIERHIHGQVDFLPKIMLFSPYMSVFVSGHGQTCLSHYTLHITRCTLHITHQAVQSTHHRVNNIELQELGCSLNREFMRWTVQDIGRSLDKKLTK